MNVCATSHDPATQRTIIAAGHNEKCQTYELQLAIENVSQENPENNNSGKGAFITRRFSINARDNLSRVIPNNKALEH